MVELRDHQQLALTNLSNGKILWGGVGTGKSLTALAYAKLKEPARDIYIITTAKKRDSKDWESEAARFGLGKPIVVDSWNNIQKYINITQAFFIFDEQRLVGSGSWVKAFIKIARRNHWILLSATPGDTWMDYVPVFVANGFYSNRTDFKREHVVYNTFAKFPKIDRYVGVGKLARQRQQVLVEMPYVRETLRNIIDVDVPYDAELLARVTKDRWNVYENRPLKDIGELYRVARQVVNSDPRRLAKVAELVSRHPKTIIFYNFDYELELLRTLCEVQNPAPSTSASTPLVGSLRQFGSLESPTAPTSLALTEWNGHKHQRIPLEHDRWTYLVQYTAGAEGWNCTDTDTMIFFSLNYSYKIWHQSQGRIDRLNTPYRFLTYYVLGGKSWIDLAIRKSLRQKRDFSETPI